MLRRISNENGLASQKVTHPSQVSSYVPGVYAPGITTEHFAQSDLIAQKRYPNRHREDYGTKMHDDRPE